jgi:hypothetical protein
MSAMALEAVNVIYFLSLCIHILFSFIHIQEGEEHSWFLNMKSFSWFASSGLSSSNTDYAWHFEVQGLQSIALEFVF